MGLFSTKVSAITREKAMQIARASVTTRRDDMEQITIINATQKPAMNIEKFAPQAGLKFFWAKRDSWAEGRFFISIKQEPYGWQWMEDNHAIMVFPDGTRLNFDHRVGWVGKVLEAGQVYEYKEMDVTAALPSILTVFDQDEDFRLRVGRFDYFIDSRFFAYAVALKEEIDKRNS